MRISDWSSDVCSSDLADGNGHGHGDKRDDQGAEEDRHGAEGALACHLFGADRDLRLPVEAEQELAQGYTVEEPECLEVQRNHDTERGEDGHHGAGDHQDVEDTLDAVTGTELRLTLALRDGEGKQAGRGGASD